MSFIIAAASMLGDGFSSPGWVCGKMEISGKFSVSSGEIFWNCLISQKQLFIVCLSWHFLKLKLNFRENIAMDILRGWKKGRNRLCGDYCTKKVKCNIYSFVITFVVVTTLLFPGISEAYLDSGSGSFVFQMIIAAVLVVLYLIWTFRGSIKKFFKKENKE